MVDARRVLVIGADGPVAAIDLVAAGGRRFGFGQDRGRKLVGQPVAADDDLGVDARIIGKAEDVGQDHGAPVGGDDHARGGEHPGPGGQGQLGRQGQLEGDEARLAVMLGVESDEPFAFFFDDADDAALGPALFALGLDQDFDRVAVDRALGETGREEDIAPAGFLGHDETEAPPARLEAAPDDVGIEGQEIAGFNAPDEAAALHFAEVAFDAAALLARCAQLAEDFRQRQPELLAAKRIQDLDLEIH